MSVTHSHLISWSKAVPKPFQEKMSESQKQPDTASPRATTHPIDGVAESWEQVVLCVRL